MTDYTKYAILYVDDEESSIRTFRRAYGERFRILSATNARDGFNLLKKHADEIGIVLADYRMPGERGVWLLEQTREVRASIVRILTTTSIPVPGNGLYKVILKPWDPDLLETTLALAFELFTAYREWNQLLDSAGKSTLVEPRSS